MGSFVKWFDTTGINISRGEFFSLCHAHSGMKTVLTLLTMLACLTLAPAARAQVALDHKSAVALLGSGTYILLMRHTQTEAGTGDPPHFKLGDCSTQRNLNGEGREQARAWGRWFQQYQIRLSEIRSSAWCRCEETARLAFANSGARITLWPALNSFFDAPSRRELQTAQVFQELASYRGQHSLMLVTHQVNITALTGVVPAMGEIVVTRYSGGRLLVLGRIAL
jgi:phosphohistidine phosphatase SixA